MADDSPDSGVGEAELHAGAPVTRSRGQEVLHPSIDTYVATIRTLRDDEGFILCVDVTGVDYLERPLRDLPPGMAGERFEVVVDLVAMDPPRRVRVRVQVPEADAKAPSLWDLYPGTEAFEREVFDLMGIRFDGHANLVRLLMEDDWEGHPLRKDYPIGGEPVRFSPAE